LLPLSAGSNPAAKNSERPSASALVLPMGVISESQEINIQHGYR
jgi:hypothetical protein